MGKKHIAPPYARAKYNSLQGVGAQVMGDNMEGAGAYNPNTRGYYNGRKKQYNLYSLQQISAASNLPNRGINIKANLGKYQKNERTERAP